MMANIGLLTYLLTYLYHHNDCLMRNKVRHYALKSCIKNRYHLIDIKIEKSPFPIKFVHRPLKKKNSQASGWVH